MNAAIFRFAWIAYTNHQTVGRLNLPDTRRWVWLMFAAGFVLIVA
jgi:hypothetical protein